MTVIDKVIKEIAEAVQKAMREAAEPLFDLAKEATENEDRSIAKTFCNSIRRNEVHLGTDLTKELLEGVALKHNLNVSVGDYGSGQFLLLPEDAEWYSGYEVGDWISSSETC